MPNLLVLKGEIYFVGRVLNSCPAHFDLVDCVAMIHVDARRLGRRRIQPSPPLMGFSAGLFT